MDRVAANSPSKKGSQNPEDNKPHPDGAVEHQSGEALAAVFFGNHGKGGHSRRPGDNKKQDIIHCNLPRRRGQSCQLGTELNSVPKTLRLAKKTAKKICLLRHGSCPSIPLNFLFY